MFKSQKYRAKIGTKFRKIKDLEKKVNEKLVNNE